MSVANFSYAYASNHSDCNYFSEKYFQINNCGAIRVINNKSTVSMREARVDYMLLYVLEGSGWAEINGIKHPLSPGEVLLLKPGAPLHFGFQIHSTHFWMHFTGSASEEMLCDGGLRETGIYNLGVSQELWEIFTDIYLQHSLNSNSSILKANGLFFDLLSRFSEIFNPLSNPPDITREKKIYPALKEMTINFDKNHKLEHYAELCGISLSDFQHSFTKITGTTPQKYITAIRLDVAKKLLISSKESVKEISFAVGYTDPLYFSRIFKKATGMSPKEYAKTSKKTPNQK